VNCPWALELFEAWGGNGTDLVLKSGASDDLSKEGLGELEDNGVTVLAGVLNFAGGRIRVSLSSQRKFLRRAQLCNLTPQDH